MLLAGDGEKPCREWNLVINYRGSTDRDENAARDAAFIREPLTANDISTPLCIQFSLLKKGIVLARTHGQVGASKKRCHKDCPVVSYMLRIE